MKWYGNWKENVKPEDLYNQPLGMVFDLERVPHSSFGVSDCMQCRILPESKDTLRMTLELWLNGRVTAEVRSNYQTCLGWSLEPGSLNCSWWEEKA